MSPGTAGWQPAADWQSAWAVVRQIGKRVTNPLQAASLPYLALALLLGSCSLRPTPTGAQIDPALSILIPPDTVLAVAARVDKLRATPVYQKYIANRDFPQLDQLAHFTGMDPRKDLWQLLFLSDLKHNAILARGNFGDDMELKLQKEGARSIGYKSYHLVGSDDASVVFFNSTTAAMGNVESLKSLLDARGKSKGPPLAMAVMMKDITATAQVWAVYTGGSVKLPFELPGNLANVDNILAVMQMSSVYLDAGDGIKGLLRIVCESEAGAKQIRDALKAFIGMGRLMAPQNQPDLLRVYDGLQASQEGVRVDVRIDEPQSLVEKFIGQLLDAGKSAGAAR